MSLVLPILMTLSSGPGKGRMELECERVRVAGATDRYRLFALEGDRRWEVLPPGALPDTEGGGWSRDEAFSAALLAGFSKRQVERALRHAE
jgi:hypothetical protein